MMLCLTDFFSSRILFLSCFSNSSSFFSCSSALKKAEKERLKKEKEQKKKQKAKSKKAKQPVEDLETVLEKLTLDDGTAGDDATEDEAICPNCGKLYSSDTENELWVCCDKCYQWYDFKCTKLRSKKRLPDTYICDLCK